MDRDLADFRALGPSLRLRRPPAGVSADAIANYQFQVNVCHARMKDGTLVALDPGQGLDRLDLKEAFARESVVRVYLAVPKLKIGAANVRGNRTGRRTIDQAPLCGSRAVGPGREHRRQRSGGSLSHVGHAAAAFDAGHGRL